MPARDALHARVSRTWVVAVGLMVLPAVPAAAADRVPAKGSVRIAVLSTRADLVSGGEALVRVELPKGAHGLTLDLGGRDVTSELTVRKHRRMTGLIDGLALGPNVLTARLKDGRRARLTITNHPKGGPLLAGPQVQPWMCTTQQNGLGAPTDSQCNAPTKVSYLYQPAGADPGKYKDYDPAKPPTDVATTKTDNGRTVPYIIRVEEGTVDRSIYKIYVLADPAKPWTATNPQPGWDRKLFVAFGGGCGALHEQTPPTQAGTGYPFGPIEFAFGDSAADGEIQQPDLIARGWMAASTGLNTLNQDCDDVVSAEALMMLKEHIVDRYGPVMRTISTGGSGGSIQQYNIAASYPGLLDGIVPTQSFPDIWAMTWDTSDCYLADHYFTQLSPELWTDLQQQFAVEGKSGVLSCSEFVATLADWFDPQNRGPFHAGGAVRFGCQFPQTDAYSPLANPHGPRCSVQDLQNAIWGHGGPHDAAPLPFDNTGVQYGLKALQRGAISPAQFVDLNARIGGLDNEGNFTATRSSMSDQMATTMYRAGRTTDARQLAGVPIIDARSVTSASSPEGLSDMHQPYFTRVTRARLDAANGTHANQVTWSVIPQNMDIDGVLAMDRWLQAIAADKSNRSRAQKVIADKPADLVDTCWIDGKAVTDQAACAKQYPPTPNGGDARLAAGEALVDNVRKCRLKPLQRSDYTVTFTDAQWQQLQATFPNGVCDYSRPSVGEQPSIPWMTYATGPGGTPLGAPPTSTPINRTHR